MTRARPAGGTHSTSRQVLAPPAIAVEARLSPPSAARARPVNAQIFCGVRCAPISPLVRHTSDGFTRAPGLSGRPRPEKHGDFHEAASHSRYGEVVCAQILI